MLTALKNGEQVFAYEVERDGGPFCCKFCNGEMRYRAGAQKSPHFFHHRGKNASPEETICLGVLKYGSGGESASHIELKRRIFIDAKRCSKIKRVEMEYRAGNSIIDVALIGEYRKVAIEVQLASLSRDKMFERMWEHYNNGFSTLWVVEPAASIESLRDPANKGSQWKVRKVHRDIHDYSQGTLFHYAGDLQFDTIHLMGWAYETFKHHKVGFKPVQLFELVDEELHLKDGEPWGKVTTLKKDERWWLKPKTAV